MPNFYNTELNVYDWAKARNLIEGSNPEAQMKKLYEEVDELGQALADNDEKAADDAIGDILVVLSVISFQRKKDLDECYHLAYEEIKDRKGRMENGIFVKEA